MKETYAWTAGWGSTVREPDRVPCAGRPAGDGFPNVWTSGYNQEELHRCRSRDGHVHVLIAGPCLVSGAELERALPVAARGRWDALAQWSGSYLTVLSDDDETVVFGDLAGTVTVFYTLVEGGVLWATAATPLADYAGAAPNWEHLGLELVLDKIAPFGGMTPYYRVHAVPPGWALRIGPDGHRVERWYELRPEATFAQTAAGMGEALIDGVARRAACASPISCEMGGTDSTVLAALAALVQRTIAITYVDTETTRDLEHGRRVEDSLPGLTRHLVRRAPTMHYYDGAGRLEGSVWTDLPSETALHPAWNDTVLRPALDAGARVHMLGVGGDEALCSGPATLLPLFRAGRVASAALGAAALARRARVSQARAIIALAVNAVGSYEGSLKRAAVVTSRAGIEPERAGAWDLLAPVQAMAARGWLTRDGARPVAQLIGLLAEQRPPWPDPEVCRQMRAAWRNSQRLAGCRQLAARLGITVTAPWLDNEILVRSHRLPSWQREPRGEFKALARAGLRGVVPPVVTERTGKDRLTISRASQRGLRENAPCIRAVVGSSQLVAEGILSLPELSAGVERVIARADTGDPAFARFLAVEQWLARSPRVWWTVVRLCPRRCTEQRM
jgi:asparagine synthase (glutamine-hydrolysing)